MLGKVETEYQSYATSFQNWLRQDMPAINAGVLSGHEKPNLLISPIQHFVDQFPRTAPLSGEQKRDSIKYLGFAMSSLERHMQDRGSLPGEALNAITGAEPLLIVLGKESGHSPRDSLYTFAYWNRLPSITFSGDPQEELFIDIVNLSSDSLQGAGDLIRPVAEGSVSLDNPVSSGSMIEAADRVVAAREQLFRYIEKNKTTGGIAYSVNFFRDVMRQYNCNWMIDGEMWGPPTAANAVPQFKLDFLVGTLKPGYREHLEERYKYFTVEDQETLTQDMDSPSVLDQIAQRIGIENDQFTSFEPGSLASLLSQQPDQALKSMRSLVRLGEKMGNLSSIHWTLLHRYLIKPNQQEEAKRGAVDNTKGGSGMEFPEVQELRDMRRLHPQIARLSEALDLLAT